MQESFLNTMRQQLDAVAGEGFRPSSETDACADAAGAGPRPEAAAAEPWCVALGVHLCGPLSPRAIALFEACERLSALILVPCCLDPRTDGELKAQAR